MAVWTAALAGLTGSAGAAPVVVTASEPARMPATAKPDGGLRVALLADGASGRAGVRRAVAEIVPTRRADRLAVVLRASGVARVRSEPRTALGATTGLASRLEVAWSADRTGLGTIETEVRALSRRGTTLATSRATLFVLRFGDRVLTSTAGPLDLQVGRIKALDGLSSLLRAQGLERVLGAGAATTASARATSTSMITVAGTVRFTDINGTTHAARRTDVELRETTVNGSEVVQTVATDEDGRYATRLDKPVGAADVAHAGGHNLFVRALAAGPGYSVEGSGGVHRVDSAVSKGVRNGTAVTIDLTANNTDDNDTAFSVGDAMLDVHDYMVKIATPVPAISVEFPSSKGCSCFGDGKLYMLRGDRFDYDVAHHEYGHYVASQLGIERNPGGIHNSLDNLSETRGSKDIGVRLAWGEAWPTYFGTVLQQVMKSAQRGIPGVGDTHYSDTDDASLDFDLEGFAGRPSVGEDGAIAVQRVLWDVYDLPRDTGDAVSLGDVPITNILKAARATTFSQAYAALAADVSPRRRAEIGCIAAQHKIAPVITAPANRSALTATPPTFTWTPDGGGPTYRNNSFVVQVYDAAFTTLLGASAKLAGTRFTPAVADWDRIRKDRQVLNVVVRGTQTAPPVTGPYDSCALQLGS